MSMRWGTVTDTSPLRVLLDGDAVALPFAPQSLIDPAALVVGDRVRCDLTNRRLVVLGRSGGDPRVAALEAATADTGWLNVAGTNANAFTLEAGYPPQYRRIGSVVYLRGRFFRSTAPGTGGTLLARAGALPVGFRPSSLVIITTMLPWQVTVEVADNGDIKIASSIARTTSPGYMVDGISFIADK